MSDKHPYIVAQGNLIPVIIHFRKTFPSPVDANTLKKVGFAPKNESSILNLLKFLSVIDETGSKTERGAKIFNLHNDDDFQREFGSLVQESYKDLFDLYGDNAWTLDKNALITFFRQTDQTTALTGERQAIAFQTLAYFAGKGEIKTARSADASEKKRPKNRKLSNELQTPPNTSKVKRKEGQGGNNGDIPVGLTVRIEINLPANAEQDSYDRIFRSIKEHLLNG
ncbi:DUF5343 domain-containing protein [bacterium]|nr:DUF5343 domain-containing protein [bacterium]